MRAKKAKTPSRSLRYLLYADRALQRITLRRVSVRTKKSNKPTRTVRARKAAARQTGPSRKAAEAVPVEQATGSLPAQRSVVDGVRRGVRRGHRGADRRTQFVTASRPSERSRRGRPRATRRCGPGASRYVEACVKGKGSRYDQCCADSESQRVGNNQPSG